MVRESKGLYLCKECGLTYKETHWAEECEKWCKDHNSCDLNIIKHCVNIAIEE